MRCREHRGTVLAFIPKSPGIGLGRPRFGCRPPVRPAWSVQAGPRSLSDRRGTDITDDRIAGCRIPKGSSVLISQYATHRHPGFWVDPESFEPERFLPDHVACRHRFAYFPFGAGPRQCIGKDFAMLEMPPILAIIVQNYHLKVDSNREVEPECGMNLEPRNGIPCTVHKRRGTAGGA